MVIIFGFLSVTLYCDGGDIRTATAIKKPP
jgi:hypothetical protein